MVNNKFFSVVVGLVVLSLASMGNASWEGDEITGTVDLPTLPPQYDGQMDWDNATAIVDFSAPEFTKIAANITSTADFSASTVKLMYENTTTSSFNVTYPEIDYFFGSLDVSPGGISSLTLVDSNFSQAGLISSSFTTDSITLSMPMQNTNPGESFYATFEFETAAPPVVPMEPATPIPTMSEWALIMFSILLGLMVFANRKHLF